MVDNKITNNLKTENVFKKKLLVRVKEDFTFHQFVASRP